MRDTVYRHILEESKKHATRHQIYHNVIELEFQRNKKRFVSVKPKEIKIPDYWLIDRKYNPFYVIKHSKQIAMSIRKKLIDGTYRPNPPYIKKIPKKSGGKREITVFQIPDSAISNLIYRRLLAKNKHRFSSLSYAYRDDRNVHYAIQDISIELNSYPRVFIAEFDFSDFFGSINHDYLYAQLDQNGFFVSNFEKEIINLFEYAADNAQKANVRYLGSETT